MPTYYTGNAANVTTPLTATVNGATNASPIVISTTASHNFNTNDTVTIDFVGGNTAANGTWVITVVDSTHFQLVGSTGSGAYTAGGIALDESMTPAFQIPSDGDAFTASSINASVQALADRTQALAGRGQSATKIFVNTTVVQWTPPAGVYIVLAFGFGGGGGGEKPFQNPQSVATANSFVAIGAGGGGAPLTVGYIGVNPGTTYDVVCGGGGTGATLGGSGGQNGGSTVLTLSGTPFFQAPGGVGGGGFAGSIDAQNDFSTPVGTCNPGGYGIDGSSPQKFPVIANIWSDAFGTNASDAQSHSIGAGGSVYMAFNVASAGVASGGFNGQDGPNGHIVTPGGTAGTFGFPFAESVGSAYALGGSGGGGGGGGPGGNGAGNGGNGGGANVNATGGNGTAGGNASGGSGAGGGGGGQGGQGSTPGSSGNGGNGGSGGLILVWWTSELGLAV
jgi:hypothetical protein